jgi:hypothetical protein
MCKQKNNSFCSALGEDPSTWSKNAPLPKPEWIKDSFQICFDAFILALEGKIDAAQLKLKNSRDLEMRTWYHIHAQNIAAWRSAAFKIKDPKIILPLDPLTSISNFEQKLYARDNYKCRYCSCYVMPKKLFKKAQSLVGETYLPLGRTNLTRSGFYLMFVATLDHVVPLSLGGRTNESNLVTCCWSCNYGKANYTVEQIGIDNPLDRAVDLDLENKVERLLKIALAKPKASPNSV